MLIKTNTGSWGHVPMKTLKIDYKEKYLLDTECEH